MDRWRPPLSDLAMSRKRLEWTDDTAMTLGLAEVLSDDGAIDGERLAARFHARWSAEPWRGYAGGPPAIFALVEKDGISYAEATRRIAALQFDGQGSFGNGAAMRAAPIGLFFAEAESAELYERASKSARPTHLHPLGIEGAALIAMAVSLALSLDPASPLDASAFVAGLRAACRSREYREALGTGIEAHKSAPFAIWSFIRHPRSFEDCLACTAGNGGDADTLAAMACGISGAYLGESALPKTWVDKLEDGGYIAALADRLYARATHRPMPAGSSKPMAPPDRSAFARPLANTASNIMGWEMNRVYCDDYLGRTWWHTSGSMTAVQAREALGDRVPVSRILDDAPARTRK
jgi:poly(ADP-ribose) glycohydrolase ARH3